MMFIPNMWTGEQAPPPLPPPWEADTISCGNRFDWKFERAATLSSSPGGCSFEELISDDASCSFEGFCFRRHGRGALRSPTPPRVTGMREGCDPLALSRGLFWRKLRFPTMQAVFEEFCFRRRGRGALRSPTAPRGRGARGLRALSSSPWTAVLRKLCFLMRRVGGF